MSRTCAHILITGTPGTGKSLVCKKLIETLNKDGNEDVNYINVGEFAKKNEGCIEGRDEELDCDIIDEDILVEKLVEHVGKQEALTLFDYHGADLFPVDLIDMVFVLRCDNTILYDRLESRAYSKQKMDNNLECEIFQSILDEAVECFGDDKVVQMKNETQDDLVKNVASIVKWIQEFK